VKSIYQTKEEGKLMKIGTKLGKNTIFLQIIYYVARTTLKWHKFLGLPFMVPLPFWQFVAE
jgi:hypothetical protein